MATSNTNLTSDASASASASAATHQHSEFELRRAALVGEIGESLEQVLAQMNALNRSLEGIIEIGNEFSSVEALWSQFETVMGRSEEENPNGANNHDHNHNHNHASDPTGGGSANHQAEAGGSER
ncbi:hypothetical protein G647_05107 [Cladophialophora carrionii CBS 160.54]|uniref:DASH complex subunit DAD1 n=1 Tax=Cladophialophora carrionii CBS 160.54 TaxID=1279043 RepID=V9DBG3_9EURO|nr:uncharacterized protein G647_05107 [Cladophialophora carrionii CBS 160.54]ETI23307.1 hypothetical protein G647_05107 [Cladophialophora carrionii CBS 160.54]